MSSGADKGTACSFTNPLSNYLYLMSDKGILTCLEAQTGQNKYDGSRVPVPLRFLPHRLLFDAHQ
jgi:hypothetical protein